MMLNKIRPSTDLRGILLAAGQVLSLIPSQCNRIFFFFEVAFARRQPETARSSCTYYFSRAVPCTSNPLMRIYVQALINWRKWDCEERGMDYSLLIHLFLLSSTRVPLSLHIFKDLYIFNHSFHIAFNNLWMMHISVLNPRC